MKIPSSQSPPVERYVPITVPVDKVFSEKQPTNSVAQSLQDAYYTHPGQEKLLSDIYQENQTLYKETLEQAVAEGSLTLEQAEAREATFNSGQVGPYRPKTKDASNSHLLDVLTDLEGDQFFLSRQPQQCGDGLYRPMDFYVSPGHLTIHGAAQGWEISKTKDGTDVPVADVVVVGAGPGGLMTSWQLARRGGRVVCFESELAGSNFNDGGAKAVHHMRTSVALTNIVSEGGPTGSWKHPLSLQGQIGIIRPHAAAGREGQTKLTGENMHGVPKESTDLHDTSSPATRGELWEHLSQLSHSLATDFPNAVLCERSPVQDVSYEDGLFTVTTTRGHQIKCKELVLSTGLTGSRGEQARRLPVIEKLHQQAPDSTIFMEKTGDSQTQASRLSEVVTGQKKATLVVNDRLLGDQSFRQTFASLPQGDHAAIIGSGESAVKGALELAHLNPNLTVDLFVKGRLESAQVQVPSENFASVVIENTLNDPDRTAQLAEMYKVFDTPVTPRSLQELFELQQSGRVRIVELGQYFDEDSVTLTPQSDGTTRMDLKDPEVLKTVLGNEADYKSKGLMPRTVGDSHENTVTGGVNYSAFVIAAGYHKQKLQSHPLAQLSEEAQAKIHANTISNSLHPAQTALPGLGAAGRHLAEELATRLVPDDRRVEITLSEKDRPDKDVSISVVDQFIRNGGVSPAFIDHVNEAISMNTRDPRSEAFLVFGGQDSKLRELLASPPEALSDAQKEVLQRGLELQHRLNEAKPHIYKPLT